jgi:phosphoribosylformylglycinamidine synthase subunit PurL
MGQIVESIEGLAEACRFFEVPVTGGNVSLYNETLGTPIFPTPVVGIVGTLPTDLPMLSTFAEEGATVILLGGLGKPTREQFGATQYAKVIGNTLWGMPPQLDMDYEKRVQQVIRQLVRARAVQSAHDLGEGGLAVALAECCFGPNGIGVDVRLDSDFPPEWLLFHEGPSRILVSTAEPERVFAASKEKGIEAIPIGVTLNSRVKIQNRDQVLIDGRVDELKDLWNGSLQQLLHNPVLVPNS